MMQLFPSVPPVTPGDGTTGPPPPPRSIPKDTEQTAAWTAEFAAPSPPLPHLPQPNQLNPSCNYSEFSLETCELSGSLLWAWMVPKKMRQGGIMLSQRGQDLPPERYDKDLNNILLDHHNGTGTEEKMVPEFSPDTHQPQPKGFQPKGRGSLSESSKDKPRSYKYNPFCFYSSQTANKRNFVALTWFV